MKLLSVLLVLLVVATYYAYPIVRAKLVSKGIQELAVPYEQHPQAATLRVLIAGDSTGVGTGAIPSSLSIAGRIGGDFPTADISNISENGLRLEGLLKKLENNQNKKYDLIVVQIGANDVTGFTSSKEIHERVAQVLSYTEQHGSSTVLLTSGDVGLAPVFRWPLTALFTKRTLQVREIFMQEAQSRNTVEYADLFRDKVHDVFRTNIPLYYAADRYHPSAAGYGVWYQDVKPAVERALKQP